jgi:hypothetical protein
MREGLEMCHFDGEEIIADKKRVWSDFYRYDLMLAEMNDHLYNRPPNSENIFFL